MSTTDMTLEGIRDILIRIVAAEVGIAPAELPTDKAFTSYGLDSVAVLSVGMEIEDACGVSDPPTSLLWDYPTVDSLAEALWKFLNEEALPPTSVDLAAVHADGHQ
ncbi:MAG TPA: acyl carrier protein [Pseudonocardiaceae bacterium]|jgi:acyl carrier protein|nr:acyl carrier protein [Pseudonocardiaceae bacterium]